MRGVSLLQLLTYVTISIWDEEIWVFELPKEDIKII